MRPLKRVLSIVKCESATFLVNNALCYTVNWFSPGFPGFSFNFGENRWIAEGNQLEIWQKSTANPLDSVVSPYCSHCMWFHKFLISVGSELCLSSNLAEISTCSDSFLSLWCWDQNHFPRRCFWLLQQNGSDSYGTNRTWWNSECLFSRYMLNPRWSFTRETSQSNKTSLLTTSDTRSTLSTLYSYRIDKVDLFLILKFLLFVDFFFQLHFLF